MADQPKKPRKIKDLKARLGRTIAPNQQGSGGGAVPPPNVGGAPPQQQQGGVVPPPGGAQPAAGGSVPAPSIPRGGAPGGVVPPSFGKKPQQQKSADPFAAQQAQQTGGPQEVRLVIDEKPVADSEVGRKQRGRFFIIAGAFLAVGLLVGYGAGSMMSDRQLYNLAVRDGKEIYQTVRDASETVSKAQRYVDSAMQKARGGGGSTAAVDYQAIEAIRALEKPLEADVFARRRYKAFKPQTVDALFEYYNNVNLLWSKFETLAARTLPDSRREILNESAEATAAVSTPTGCVPTLDEERGFLCGLVYVRIPNYEEGEAEPGTVFVRANRGSAREYEKSLYNGQEDLAENPENYVILTHPQRSVGVLGEQASEFAQYTALMSEIKQLMDRTMEVQGRLERELGDVARLEEVFAF